MQTVEVEGREVRTVTINNEPWFAASDVCEALEIDPSAVDELDDDEHGTYQVETPAGAKAIRIVSEPGFYGLLLWHSSKGGHTLRWLFGEVLPSIQTHGCYPPNALEQLLDDPGRLLEVTRAQVERRRAENGR